MILASLYTLLLIISFLLVQLPRLQYVAPGDAALLFVSWLVCFDLTLMAASA